MDQALNGATMAPRWHWLLFAALLLGEFLVFDRLVSKHHAWVYPRWNDQIQYLTEAYTSYEKLRAGGLAAGLRESLGNPAAQGTLHDVAAVLIFAVAGPSRSAALSVNILAFLAWQVATFAACRRLTGRWSAAWLAAGLLLTLRALVEPGPGSPIDFRLDWLGCCACGTAVSLGLLHDGFRRPGWATAFGLAVGVAIVARFLTIVYFAGAFAVLFLGLAALLAFGAQRGDALRRLLALLLAGAAAAAVAAPLLWPNREWIYNYYWIGHLTGPESGLRAPNFGLAKSLDFVFREALSSYHLGTWFWSAALGSLAAFVGLALRRRGPADPAAPAAGALPPLAPAFALGALMVIVPGLVLTLHTQKSHLTVSVLIPGTVTLGIAIAASLLRRIPTDGWRASAVAAVAALVVAAGAWHFAAGFLRQPLSGEFMAGARRVNALADYLLDTSRRARLDTPRIAVDQVTDSLDAQIMRVVCYERRGVWCPFIMTLPTGIMEDKVETLRARLKESDFVLLTDAMPGDGHWPYDRQMRGLHPEFKAWCEANLRAVESFPLFDRQMTLYQRREIR